MVTDLHNLRRHDSKSPLRAGCVASLLRCGAFQYLDFRILAVSIKDRTVTAGVELQQNGSCSGAGELDRYVHTVHVGQFILRMLGGNKRNALAADTIPHRAGFVETEQFVRVVDKQVKVSEKT